MASANSGALLEKWCLYLHHLSSKAYETIRNSGIINLPSSRTLRDYTHIHPNKMGFLIEADRQLLDLLDQKHELTKYGVVLIDEMYIKYLSAQQEHCLVLLTWVRPTTSWMTLKPC